MLCLVYVSSATHLFPEETLTEILQVSRRNNAAAGVTGLLLYSGGNILQVLEGEAAPVERLFHRIEADERHIGVHRLIGLQVERRQFPDWSMALRRPEDLPDEQRVRSLDLLQRSLSEPDTAGLAQEVGIMLDVFARGMT